MTQHIQNVVEQQSSQQVSSQQQQFSVIPLCRRYSILRGALKWNVMITWWYMSYMMRMMIVEHLIISDMKIRKQWTACLMHMKVNLFTIFGWYLVNLVTVMKTIFVTPTTSDIQEDTTGMYTPVNMTSSNQRTSRNMILAFQFDPGHSTQLGWSICEATRTLASGYGL